MIEIDFIFMAILFICAQSCSVYGQYRNLPYKNLGFYKEYMAIAPFIFMDWFLMACAIDINNSYGFITGTQTMFVIVILQFVLVLILNKYYLKQIIYNSDFLAFGFILLGFCISYYNLITNYF